MTTGNVLNFKDDNYIGIRFANIPIFQGTTIDSAYITFTANRSGTGGPPSAVIKGQADDEPRDFSGSGTNQNAVYDRFEGNWPYTPTGAAVNWDACV